MTDAEWGPWIDHDGSEIAPKLAGQFVHVIGNNGKEAKAVILPLGPNQYSQFDKAKCIVFGQTYVVRYRIRQHPSVALMKTKAAALDKLRPEVLADQ